MARTALRSQVQFAMVPLWVLERCSSRAVHVYASLMKFATRERRAWPKTEILATSMGLSLRSVERAIAELRKVGAIETHRRHAQNGAVLGLAFVLIQVDPQSDLPAAGGGKAVETEAENHPANTGGKASIHPATGVAAIPPPVSGRPGLISISELDPIEPDPRTKEQGLPPRRSETTDENPEGHLKVITRIVHEVIEPFGDPGADLPELVKDYIGRLNSGRDERSKIRYDSTLIGKAIDSARWQRRQRRSA